MLSTSLAGYNPTWEYLGIEYSAGLDCKPANEYQSLFYNDQGRSFDKSICPCDIDFTNARIFVGTANTNGHITLGNCTIDGKPTYAIIWKQLTFNQTVLASTVMFCIPNYYSQNVRVKISEAGAVLSTETLAPRKSFDNSTFDFATFKRTVNSQTRYTETAQNSFPVVGPEMPPIQNVDICTLGAAGFAIPFRPIEPTDFLRNETLRKSFEAAYNLPFATAFKSLLVQSTNPQSSVGTSNTLRETIAVVTAFMVLLECSLVLVRILVCITV